MGAKAVLDVVYKLVSVALEENFEVSASGPGVSIPKLTLDSVLMAITTSGTCRLRFTKDGKQASRYYLMSLFFRAFGPSSDEVQWVGPVRLSTTGHEVWVSSV